MSVMKIIISFVVFSTPFRSFAVSAVAPAFLVQNNDNSNMPSVSSITDSHRASVAHTSINRASVATLICKLWPFRMSSSENGNGSGGGGQHLIQAGQYLQVAAESVGPQSLACPHLLRDAADALTEIGQYWSESWEAVTYAAEEASAAFHALSRLQERAELAALYSGSSSELKAISAIVGCSSVGPPSAVPNLEGLAKYLQDAAMFVESEGECRDSRAFGKALSNASKSLRALAQEY